MFEMFTGQLPFQANSLVGMALLHAYEPPPPPRSIEPDLPEVLEALLLRMLEKTPEKRHERVEEIADAIADLSDA